jgi:Holliday junction resolvasome RuvABC ATP-dependent DNA helicase subunit
MSLTCPHHEPFFASIQLIRDIFDSLLTGIYTYSVVFGHIHSHLDCISRTYAHQILRVALSGYQCSMTAGAQQALRRTMELHSATTRFALACNQSSKIIEPIQSRCAIVRFMKLSNEDVLRQVKKVAALEHVTYDAPGLEAITFTADGDMRQALNNLQATVAGFGFVNQVCTNPIASVAICYTFCPCMSFFAVDLTPTCLAILDAHAQSMVVHTW